MGGGEGWIWGPYEKSRGEHSQNALDKILKELIKLLHLKKKEEVARISPEGLEHRNGAALLRVQRLHGVVLIL